MHRFAGVEKTKFWEWIKSMLEFRRIILVFIISRAVVISSAILGSNLIGMRSAKQGEILWNIQIPFFSLFARWDSAYYLDIAREGYVSKGHWAFRPFFPLVLKILATPLSGYMYFDASAAVMGFLANNLFLIIALIIIYRLASTFYSEKVARMVVLLVAFCPTAVFYSSIYAESLYLLILAASFYALEKGMILTSGCLGFLAGLTRPEGFLASLVIFAKGLKVQGLHAKLKTVASAFVTALSFPVFLAYANIATGDFQVVFSTEMQWDKFRLINVIREPLITLLQKPDFVGLLISLSVMLISSVAVFSFFVKRKLGSSFKSRPFPYYLLSAMLITIYVAIGDVRSLPRLFSTEMPIYWTLSLWMLKMWQVKVLITVLFISLMTIGTVLFVNWYHFI